MNQEQYQRLHKQINFFGSHKPRYGLYSKHGHPIHALKGLQEGLLFKKHGFPCWREFTYWRSKKQSAIARSGAKVEFRATVFEICEVVRIKRLLENLKILNF
jgi:hypothetical protein